MGRSLHYWQKKVFLLCWMAYASAYLCRTNLSITLPVMCETFQWNRATAGMIGSVFFWAYAVGQLVNGCLGDRFDPRRFIALGLMGSAVINLLVGCLPNLLLILILWAVNGFLLATVWGPIVRTTAAWFSPGQRTKVAVGLALSMIGGYALSWGLVGVVVNYTSWSWGFFAPGLFTLAFALFFLKAMRANPAEVGFPDHSGAAQEDGARKGPILPAAPITLPRLIVRERLWLIALACVAQGVIKDGITLWTPTFLHDSYDLSQSAVSMLSSVVPMVSILGIFLAGWLNQKYLEREKVPIVVLLLATALCCTLMFLVSGRSMALDVALLSISSALMYGANMLLLTMVPLGYAKFGKASGVTGFLDFCAYAGAGLSGFATGLLVDSFGWRYISVSWAVLAVVGIAGVLLAYRRRREVLALAKGDPL